MQSVYSTAPADWANNALDKRGKIFCVSTHLETKSFKTVPAKFCGKFNFNNYPQRSQIYRWIYKFQATGSVNNLNKKAENPISGRELTASCPNNVDSVRDSVGKSSKKSLRRRSQELSISRASLQRILKDELQLYPYRIQIKHKLTPADIEFLVSVINHYHINGLRLFGDTLYTHTHTHTHTHIYIYIYMYIYYVVHSKGFQTFFCTAI